MKQVGIAELKSRLSEYLRAVRRGETIYVLDRETAVAQDCAGSPEKCIAYSKARSRHTAAQPRPASQAGRAEARCRGAADGRAPGASAIAYVDASVLLRLALGQPDASREWRDIHQGVSSALITVESLRTLDRLRIRAKLSDPEVASCRATVLKIIASLDIVEITSPVLERAAQARNGDRLWLPTHHGLLAKSIPASNHEQRITKGLGSSLLSVPSRQRAFPSFLRA